jgi:3-oxoacyl-[acyl-carrier protein] reductase
VISIDLNGKLTLVIGGARGIGAAIVRASAASGSNVVWTCLDTSADIKASENLLEFTGKAGVKAFYRTIDCTDEQGTQKLTEEMQNKLGPVNNLVHCAGYTSQASLLELHASDWRRVVDINLTGAFISVRSVIEQMKTAGRGSVVLIGSAAIVAGGGGRVDYVSAKAGLEGLNRAVTKEFSPFGIRCNIIHPSLVDTDLLKIRHPEEEKRAQLAESVPLKRLGMPEDIAFATIFLLSDLASYITGQSLFIDGGRTFCK